MSKQKKAKIFAAAVGFYGRRKNCFRTAVRAVHKSWQYAYIGRKLKKRDMRALWIQQINAGARLHGLSYAKLMRGLEASSIELNRKSLANLAATEPYSFKAVVEAAKLAREASKAEPQLR
jgi:large subunit ribosomal protein L20